MLLAVVLLLVFLAVAGGLAVHPVLFLIALIAIALAFGSHGRV